MRTATGRVRAATQLDPSGVPLEAALVLVGDGHRLVHVPGLTPSSIAIVEALAQDLGPRMELWGTVAGRPVLFEVDGGTGHEMLADLDTGDHPTAILEPGQVLLESLD